MGKPASRLGRGLNALVTHRSAATNQPSHATPGLGDHHQTRLIPVDGISPNPRQPRTTFAKGTLDELAASIRANGVLQPIVVRSMGDHKFELVAGERRLRAAKLAGLATIPAIVRELSDAQSFEIALIENLQREDLAPLERASAYQHYLDTFGGTIEDLATRLSESRANVSNYMRLLKLRPEICYLLGSGGLGMGQARAIAGITDPKRQLAIAKLAARRNLSVRQVEELARAAQESTSQTPPESEAGQPNGARQHLVDIERALAKALGLRVRLLPGRKKNAGRVIISYANLEEFDRIAERLGGDAHLE